MVKDSVTIASVPSEIIKLPIIFPEVFVGSKTVGVVASISFLCLPSESESVDQSRSQENVKSLPSGSKLFDASRNAESPDLTCSGTVRFRTGAPLTTIVAEISSSPPWLLITVKVTVYTPNVS